MQKEFILHLSELLPNYTNLDFADLRLIVAVSGGVDSVLLLHILHEANINCIVAHVNFQLRGEESERDMQFVEKLAEKLNYPCSISRVDTLQYAENKKLSIQVAARELRYHFFEELRQKYNADFIATAQHLNDSIETVIYNLSKGCGLRGLHGILPIQGYILRPLHYMRKTEILAYAAAIGLEYVEDSSNNSDKYSRNYIRHHIIPALAQINPQLEQTFSENIARFRATEQLLDWTLTHLRPQYWQHDNTNNSKFVLDLEKLRLHPCANLLCYEWLSPLGFSAAQCQNIIQTNVESNSFWLSDKYRAVYYRGVLTINLSGQTKQELPKTFIFNSLQDLEDYQNMQMPRSSNNPVFQIKTLNIRDFIFDKAETNTAFFDIDNLVFPLTLRKVQAGDKIRLLGMKGKSKKISDFFKDIGVEVKLRQKAWLLIDANNNVIWLVGYRSSEIGKVDSQTTRVLQIKI